MIGDVFATAKVRYGLSAPANPVSGAGYRLVDISEPSINTAKAA